MVTAEYIQKYALCLSIVIIFLFLNCLQESANDDGAATERGPGQMMDTWRHHELSID